MNNHIEQYYKQQIEKDRMSAKPIYATLDRLGNIVYSKNCSDIELPNRTKMTMEDRRETHLHTR